jgi:hypothetical protein
MRHLNRRAALAALALSLALPLTAAAQAPVTRPDVPDPAPIFHVITPDRGQTTLTPSKGLVAVLHHQGIGLSGLDFAVTGGRYSFGLRSARGGGLLTYKGDLVAHRGRRSAALSALQVRIPDTRTGGRGTLTAVLGARRIAVATLNLSKYRVTQSEPPADSLADPYDDGFSGVVATLTDPAAAALNGALGTAAFKGGDKLGALKTTKTTDDIQITGGSTEITLTPDGALLLSNPQIGLIAADAAKGNGYIGTPLTFPLAPGPWDFGGLAGTIGEFGDLVVSAPAGKKIPGTTESSSDLTDPNIHFDPDRGTLIFGAADFEIFEGHFRSRTTITARGGKLHVDRLYLNFAPAAAQLLAPLLNLDPTVLAYRTVATADVDATYKDA